MVAAAGKQVLIVEDEFMLARQIGLELRARGFGTVGPGATPTDAESLAREAQVDGAVIYSRARREVVFNSVRSLVERHVPFVYISAEEDRPPDWIPSTLSFGGNACLGDVIDEITAMLNSPVGPMVPVPAN